MFSLVIPTLNEEKYLPRLLNSVKKQKLQPAEIIVADADSDDNTRRVAKKYGCKVVHGGKPAVGRNNGAEAAKGNIIVFMDADTVIPGDSFLNKIIGKFISKNADVASCFILPSEKRLKYSLPFMGINALRYALYKVKLSPIMQGACMITTREVFQKLRGFDTSLFAREDNDFFRRALKAKMKYIVIRHNIKVSTRRFEKKGLKIFLVTGLITIGAVVIGSSWLKRQKEKADRRFWDDIK